MNRMNRIHTFLITMTVYLFASGNCLADSQISPAEQLQQSVNQQLAVKMEAKVTELLMHAETLRMLERSAKYSADPDIDCGQDFAEFVETKNIEKQKLSSIY